MPCSTVPANWIKQAGGGSAPPVPPANNLAAYDVQNQYAQTVDNWINTFPQQVKNPRKIVLTKADFQKSSWSDLGFDSSSVTVSGSVFWFFRATYTENSQTKSVQLSLDEAGNDFKITLSFTGLQPFTVNPSAMWCVEPPKVLLTTTKTNSFQESR